jgi:hypothetical protein
MLPGWIRISGGAFWVHAAIMAMAEKVDKLQQSA